VPVKLYLRGPTTAGLTVQEKAYSGNKKSTEPTVLVV